MHTVTSHPSIILLHELVTQLNIEGFEKSFKLTHGSLFEQRALIGVTQISQYRRAIFNICHLLNMPEEHLQLFREYFSNANRAYFGYEETPNACTHKVYLEFWDYHASKKGSPHDPFMLYLGFKWDVTTNNNTLTRYTLYPEISSKNILEKIDSIYPNHSNAQALSIAKKIITTASKKTNARSLKYLEVTEDNNPRKSFDINLYEAGLRTRDIYAELIAMQKYYQLNATKFHEFYNSIKRQDFGHLSGGIDKLNNDFMTFYYEVYNLS